MLEAHHLVGRSTNSSLRLEELSVSGEHASLRWTGRNWVVKDLASRYGTFLNSQPVPPGLSVPIAAGGRLAFGRGGSTWVMTEDSPPQVMVVPVDGGAALLRSDGMIAIPSQDEPKAVVFQERGGRWTLDQAGRVQAVNAEVPFLADGVLWRLCNTSPALPTSADGDDGEMIPLDEVHLQFGVSRNEEHVALAVLWRDRLVDMQARSHHYLLLTLARARLNDVARGEPPALAGWIDQEDILRLLRMGPERLNLDIFRARRHFGAAGFVPGAGIVERRTSVRDLRIGAGQITVNST